MQTNNQVKQDEFRVGDTVWCLVRGKGTVVEIDNYGTYPVKVQFPQHSLRDSYTVDGRLEMTSRERTLFFSEPKVEASVTRPFVPTLVGKRVVVRVPACYDVVLEIEWENKHEFGNQEYAFSKNSAEVYEVSSENLLKKD